MKNITVIISTLLLFMLFSSFCYQANKTVTFTGDVEKLRNSKGIVQFALYNKDGSIPNENFKRCYKILKANIVNSSSTVISKNIQIGKYAVNIFHDENNNGKIDKGFILPIEGIGFSNIGTINLSNRSSCTKASFDLVSDKYMTIKLIYL